MRVSILTLVENSRKVNMSIIILLQVLAVYPVVVFLLFTLLKIDYNAITITTTKPWEKFDHTSGFDCFVAGVLFFYIIETILRIRKHLAFANGLPKQLIGRVTDEKYQESTVLNKFKNQFGAVKDILNLVSTFITIFIFWPATWSLVQTKFKDYSYAQNLIIPALWSSLIELIDLLLMGPINGYATFVVDKKHNNHTLYTYIKDKVKTLLMSVVLNGLVLFALISIVDWAGPDAWKYMIGFVICVVICIQILFPVTVAKCFNTFTPLPEGELKITIDELVSKTELDCKQCYMVDGSTQSKHSNAYVAGMCGTRRIVIYDTLVKDLKNDKARINAVVGHEIGHAKLNHNWILTTVMAANLSSMFYIFSFFQSDVSMVKSFGFPESNTFLILSTFMAVYGSCIMPLFSVLANCIVRQLEFAADKYSVELGYDIRLALLDLGLENLSDMNPDPWHAAYHYSHPPLVQRLDAVKELLGGQEMPDSKVINYIKMPDLKKDDPKKVAEETDLPVAKAVEMKPPTEAPPPQGVAAQIGIRES